MAATTTRPTFGGATGNSYSSTTTQVANSQPRFVDRLLEALDFSDVPLQKLFGMGAPVTNRKLEWADERLSPVSDTVGATAVLAGDATITVSNGVRFQQYDLIKIGSEVILVTAISANVLTVTRAWGGTTAAGAAAGATVEILGPALPENTSTPPSPMSRGEFYSNFFQLFDYGFQISDRENNADNYLIRGKEYNYEVEKKYREAAIDLERMLFHGVAADASGALPSSMGGFPAYITTNVTAIAGTALTKAAVMTQLQTEFASVGPSNMGKLLIMNAFTKRVFNSFWSDKRRVDAVGGTISESIDTIDTDFGPVKLLLHYWCPVNALYMINPKNYSIRPFGSYGRWHDEFLAKDGPFQKGHLVGDYTLEAKGNRAHAKITGYSTTASDYAAL